MIQQSPAPSRALVAVTAALALALGLLAGGAPPTARAAAPPVLDRGTAVTSDVLPTTQINPGGYVQDQAVVGDTVYAGGSFSSARPAGQPAGSGESTRGNLLAYSISTGELVAGFHPDLNGVVRVLALSPDAARLYVGGEFTAVDGVTRNRLVAIDTATGEVDPTFAVSLGGPVYAISATGSTVYVGGQFTQANGTNRGRLAAFRAATGELTGWAPKSGDFQAVRALLVAPTGDVIAGGQFASIGNLSGSGVTEAPGSASLDPVTGAVKPWAVNKLVKQYGADGGVLSLKTDGTTVYGSGYWFGGVQANFEGVWAVDPAGGEVRWLADCHGDTYDTTISGGVVYAASHQHDCSNIGAFGEQRPTRVEWRANAFTTEARGEVQHNSLLPTKFKDFEGYPAPSVVSWYPQFTNGPTNGYYAGQPTLTVESGGDYVAVGGQFPTVNGVEQQGLVRFARAASAPDQDGPRLYGGSGPTVRVVGSNVVRVTASPWDRDGAVLRRVELWRTDRSAPVWSADDLAAPWWKTTVAYLDRDVRAGTAYRYYVRSTDADGNTATSAAVSVTPSGDAIPDSAYADLVAADGASGYWRLDDASGGVTDWVGSTDLALASGATTRAAGAIAPDRAVTVNGTGSASAANPNALVRAPQTFSVEAWFKTSSKTGGQVVGFGDVPTGASYVHDRMVYLNADGRLVYQVSQGTTPRSITSPKSYNDAEWHQVVATLSSTSGMVLYVDGAKAASWAAITSARDYNGYWRVGADVLPGKSASSSSYLYGALDDVSLYPTALTAAQVRDHFAASGGSAKATPTAAFEASCTGLSCRYDGSGSTTATPGGAGGATGAGRSTGAATAPDSPTDSAAADPGGSAAASAPALTDYHWSFGDGARATRPKAGHSYRRAGTFEVGLTVTDAEGNASTTVESVATEGNDPPRASFTSTARGTRVTLDAGRSADRDGTVATYAWSLGDGATSTRRKLTHTYAGTGAYAVRLTVTDDEGARTSTTKVVRTGGRVLARDDFSTTGTGWGRADRGGRWRTGPAAAFARADGTGTLDLAAPGAAATATLPAVSTRGADLVGRLSAGTAGSAAGTTAAYVLRQRSGGGYRGALELGQDGAAVLVASRVVGGREEVLARVPVTGLAYAPGDVLRFRARISGATTARIRLTVWPDGTPEPRAQLTTTDAAKALRRAGAVGVAGHRASTAPDAPVRLTFDDLHVTAG